MRSQPKIVCIKMYHPKYGYLMSEPDFWNSGSEKWISGYWGPTWIFANAMVAEIELNKTEISVFLCPDCREAYMSNKTHNCTL